MSNRFKSVGSEGKLDTPWDKAYQHSLIRNSPVKSQAPYVLEFGVNYFVLKLESLDLATCWSCEGHPSDFYMVFKAPFHQAVKVAFASINYADIAITRGYKM